MVQGSAATNSALGKIQADKSLIGSNYSYEVQILIMLIHQSQVKISNFNSRDAVCLYFNKSFRQVLLNKFQQFIF